MRNNDFLPFFTVILLACSLLDKFAIVSFGILLLLKLIGILTVSWWVVCIPIYFWIPLCVLGLVLDFIYYLIRVK